MAVACGVEAGPSACLRDGGTGEGVGLADVGACLEVAAVDLTDCIRLREDEQIVVALQLLSLRDVSEFVACHPVGLLSVVL
mgnify:CR=1 FL=1